MGIYKEVKSAYLCNRKYFNASESSIALLWMTGKNKENDYIEFDSDIDKIKVYKTTERPISYIKTCNKEDAVVVMRILGVSCTNAHLNGDLDNVENTSKANKQFGKYISKDELLYMLPYYVAVKIDFYSTGKNPYDDNIDYRVIDTIYRSADKEERYKKDNKFLQDCLLYTLCTNKHKVSEDNFYKVCEELLDIFHKETEIYKLYKELVESTGVNGLYNIEKYKTHEYGKLYIYGTFGPQIEKLKNLLNIFQYEVIRPKMLEYELLK